MLLICKALHHIFHLAHKSQSSLYNNSHCVLTASTDVLALKQSYIPYNRKIPCMINVFTNVDTLARFLPNYGVQQYSDTVLPQQT